jgi:hypothetical protein
MKKFNTLLFCILVSFSFLQAQIVWDNFEDVRKGTYGFINGVFIPYNANPDQSGANTSQVAAQYTRNPAEAFDVIILDAPMADLSDYVSGSKQISIDVWSPAAGITLQITMENSVLALPANFPTGRHSVYLTTTTVANAWETLTFTFDNQPDASVADDSVDRLVLLFNPNTNTGDTYYWDNLTAPELANDPCDGVTPDLTVFNDFECQQNINFTFSHAGVNFRRVVNPDQSGINESAYVASYTRNAGEENDVIVGFTKENLDLTVNNKLKMDVWDPGEQTNVILSLQFEDAGGISTTIEDITATTSGSSQWETLEFEAIEAIGQVVNKLVILFDPGNFSSDNYYFDNLGYGTPVSVETLTRLEDFEVSPNPTSGMTQFSYELKKSAQVQLAILDVTGKRVAEVVNTTQAAGSYQFGWDASGLEPGMYFYTLKIGEQTGSGKLIKLDN